MCASICTPIGDAWAKGSDKKKEALDTQLRKAIDAADLNAVKAAIEAGADPDKDFRSNGTPIHLSIAQAPKNVESLQVFEYLWEQTRKPDYGSTYALGYLNASGNAACWSCFTQVLLNSRIDPNGFAKMDSPDRYGSHMRLDNPGEKTPLMNAASGGPDATEALKALLAHPKIKLEMIDVHGLNALHYAATSGTEAAVKALLAAGLPLDGASKLTRETPLMWAITHGNLATTTLLLKGGASISVKDQNGDNAMCRLEPKQVDPQAIAVAKLLIEKGADANQYCGGIGMVKSTPMRSRLEQAIRVGNVEWIDLIVDAVPESISYQAANDVAMTVLMDCQKQSKDKKSCKSAEKIYTKMFAMSQVMAKPHRSVSDQTGSKAGRLPVDISSPAVEARSAGEAS